MSASSQQTWEKLGHSGKGLFTESNSAIGFPRTVTRCLKVHEMREGTGSRIRRCIGNREVRCLPPFVICEQFRMNEKGMPPHPARGSQRITYVLKGKVKLNYSPNNKIELGSGDLTSLMVGKGVIRSIKAIPEDGNVNSLNRKRRSTASCIQLFMDVPESFKRIEPSHLNLCHSDIISFSPTSGCHINILTGSTLGKRAYQMLTATPALILDCSLQPGSTVDIPVKLSWNAFAYIIDGTCTVQTEQAQKHHYVEFMRSSKIDEESPDPVNESDSENYPEEDGYVTLTVGDNAKNKARVLFCAAKPLCQPIYRQGPFVDVSMNWIHQAFDDYTSRKNGFESRKWNLARRKSSKRSSRASLPTKAFPSLTTAKKGSSCKSEEDGQSSASLTGEYCVSKSFKKCKRDGPSEAYSPCEDLNCESGRCGKEHYHPFKATYPNAFPPGSVNPASHSTNFNGIEGVKEKQHQKIRSNPNPLQDRKCQIGSDSRPEVKQNTPQPKYPLRKMW